MFNSILFATKTHVFVGARGPRIDSSGTFKTSRLFSVQLSDASLTWNLLAYDGGLNKESFQITSVIGGEDLNTIYAMVKHMKIDSFN